MIKNLLTLVVVVCISAAAVAQTNDNTPSPSKKEVSLKATSTPVAKINPNANAPVSEYKSYEKKILKVVKGDKIPADFPKYNSAWTEEQYVQKMKEWVKNNKDQVNPEYMDKLK